jgi:hypothetical protein
MVAKYVSFFLALHHIISIFQVNLLINFLLYLNYNTPLSIYFSFYEYYLPRVIFYLEFNIDIRVVKHQNLIFHKYQYIIIYEDNLRVSIQKSLVKKPDHKLFIEPLTH